METAHGPGGGYAYIRSISSISDLPGFHRKIGSKSTQFSRDKRNCQGRGVPGSRHTTSCTHAQAVLGTMCNFTFTTPTGTLQYSTSSAGHSRPCLQTGAYSLRRQVTTGSLVFRGPDASYPIGSVCTPARRSDNSGDAVGYFVRTFPRQSAELLEASRPAITPSNIRRFHATIYWLPCRRKLIPRARAAFRNAQQHPVSSMSTNYYMRHEPTSG